MTLLPAILTLASCSKYRSACECPRSRDAQLLVIGGGPGGYPAALHAADHDLKVTLVDEDPKLGGVCLNRGCIPSKALLHAAKLIREAHDFARLRHLVRRTQDRPGETPHVRAAESGRQAHERRRPAHQGPRRRRHQGSRDVHRARRPSRSRASSRRRITFKNCIIATGSVPIVPKPWQLNDPRVMDSTAALLLPDIPKRLLVIGGGYIGLEIGSVYAALGSKVTVVEAARRRSWPWPTATWCRRWKSASAAKFEAIYTSTKVAALEAKPEGIRVTLEGQGRARRAGRSTACSSRSAGVPTSPTWAWTKQASSRTQKGFITVDRQRRTNVPHIQAIGDIAGEPGLAHKATAEARVAVDVLLGEPAEWSPRAIPAVIFTDPEIAWAGTDAEGRRSAERSARDPEIPLGRERPGRVDRPHRRADQDAGRSRKQARAGCGHCRRRGGRDDRRRACWRWKWERSRGT